ncbi:hypothetical protein BGZ94_002490, partial [Podila epigama]
MPRETPVLFTLPYPPYGHHFPASVQVTGNFDDWQRTCYLHKNDALNRFEGTVQIDLERLALISQHDDEAQKKRKVVFKYVLDGHNWVTNPEQDLERDYEGNLNNIRFLEDVTLDEEEAEKKEIIQDSSSALKVVVAAGDAQPSQDESVTPAPIKSSLVNGDEHDGDGDYGVVLLRGEPVTLSTCTSSTETRVSCSSAPSLTITTNMGKGDEQPSVDDSIATVTDDTNDVAEPMPTSASSESIKTVVATTSSTLTCSAPSVSSRPSTLEISTVSSTLSEATSSSPTTPSPTSAKTALNASNGTIHNGKPMIIKPTSTPTTAISTLAPAFPSTNTLSQLSSKTDKRKS